MRKLAFYSICLLAVGTFNFSCQEENLPEIQEIQEIQEIPQKVIDQLVMMGFNPDGIEKVEEGYRIERDIIITDEFLATSGYGVEVPNNGRYSTTNVVNAGTGRVITIYASERGNSGYSPKMLEGLDEAIRRYNAENLLITFQRITNAKDAKNADISMTKFSKREEGNGALGSAGFPTAGDPYGEIKLSGFLDNFSVDLIATIIAHEIGHCIGLRHTDYYDRSISCGGNPVNETAGTLGANHIPGTPEIATEDASYMLSCFNNTNRPFTSYDKIALDYLY
jgi:hypothetical protein